MDATHVPLCMAQSDQTKSKPVAYDMSSLCRLSQQQLNFVFACIFFAGINSAIKCYDCDSEYVTGCGNEDFDDKSNSRTKCKYCKVINAALFIAAQIYVVNIRCVHTLDFAPSDVPVPPTATGVLPSLAYECGTPCQPN